MNAPGRALGRGVGLECLPNPLLCFVRTRGHVCSPSYARSAWWPRVCVLTAAVREGEAWEYCPRTALRRSQALLLEHFGLTLKVRVYKHAPSARCG